METTERTNRRYGPAPLTDRSVIGQLMQELGLNDASFANVFGTTRRTAKAWRLGDKKPRTGTLKMIATEASRRLGRSVTVGQLVGSEPISRRNTPEKTSPKLSTKD